MDISIIFDLDGVIINSEPMHQKIERQMMADRDVKLLEAEHLQFVGMAGYDMWKILKERYSLADTIDELRAEKRARLEEFLNSIDDSLLVPGSVDCIVNFHKKGLTLALASSSGRWYVEHVLNHFALYSYFSAIVTGWDVVQSKPAPDIFLLAAEKMKKQPNACVVIEDSRNGIRAAKAAGMLAVGYANPNTLQQELSEADLVIHDFSYLGVQEIYRLCNKEKEQ